MTRFSLDRSQSTARFREPRLLVEAPVPLMMRGVVPRVLLGGVWWDRIRHAVYRYNNNCCWACGRNPVDDPLSRRLEAHESYAVDDARYEMRLRDVVGLCEACHAFVHIGLHYGNWPSGYLRIIADQRIEYLQAEGVQAPYTARLLQLRLNGKSLEEAQRIAASEDLAYPPFRHQETILDWRLLLNGHEYDFTGRRHLRQRTRRRVLDWASSNFSALAGM